MGDLLSELKRIKAQLRGGSASTATQPTRGPVAPGPVHTQLAPLRNPHDSAVGLKGQLVNAQSDPVRSRNQESVRLGSCQVPDPAVEPRHATRAADPVGEAKTAQSHRPIPSNRGAAQAPQRSIVPERTPVVPAKVPVVHKSVPSQRTATIRPPPPSPAPAPARPARVPISGFEPVPSLFRPLPKGALTRQGLFRHPDDWIAVGGRTQCIETGHRGAVDIVIGLDFGTSYTKAAVGLKRRSSRLPGAASRSVSRTTCCQASTRSWEMTPCLLGSSQARAPIRSAGT